MADFTTATAITVAGKLAEGLGAIMLQACADVTRCIVLPDGGTHGSKAYRPADARRLSGSIALERQMALPFMQGTKELAFITACYELRNSTAGATVWTVQGEHFSVPGAPLSVHASEEGANAAAAALVNIMLKDTGRVRGKPRAATPSDWAGVPIGWLHDYHGAAHCWVEVCKLSVEA